MNEVILVETSGHVAEITLNRPNQRNAVNSAMLDGLQEAFRALDADDGVRVVLVRGAGSVFCAGNDLKERSTMSVEDLRIRRDKGHHTFLAIEAFAKPCIAVVHGAAIAAGCEIALSCDYILAGESATFRYPVGPRGSLGDALRLPKIAGKQVAKELLFTGRIVGATEPLAMHLVNHVLPDEDLLPFARGMAATIAEHAPMSMIGIKRAVNTGQAADPENALAMEQQAIAAAQSFTGERPG